MKIIISPAKKMNVDRDFFVDTQLPQFLSETKILQHRLQQLDHATLQNLWKCNDSLTTLNIQRLETMNLEEGLTPALFSYEGIQYRYLSPNTLEWEQLHYLQRHLRILSGFYGILRPFDGVTPYRLEMGAKLAVDGHKTLYAFWGAQLAQQLTQDGEWILNLASKEYSRAIQPHLPPQFPFLTCTFGEWKGDSILEKGTLCKMARGQMVRWLAEQNITHLDQIKAFDQLDYRFSPQHSTESHYIFLKN